MTAAALLALALVQTPPAPSARAPYWQQSVSYDITARLDEASGVLSGDERIVYRNQSPDTLTTFSLHLHLNAFRPGSRWADADSVEGRRRFNDLGDPDFAFNHVRNVRIMGQSVEPTYPFAPDSTIARFALPRPLAPGDSMPVALDWDARPSTTPRRQGRQGRRFDFAQWYPKVVVYDTYGWEEHPLYPAGEFYGEFGTFRVRLDVPEDQVVGATGVPLCGDPGWERASRQPGRPVDYRRDAYPAALAAVGPSDCAPSAAGRKTILWYAEAVHHFAMSLNPEYRYEGGGFGKVAVHVLYQPGDEQSWGGGVAVKRTETALAWLDRLFGPFAWPQLTNVHRIEGGGTEFPMMVHDGSADQGLIVHEVGHNYTMGILANNEWREGFLDEGFTSFQTSWFWETAGRQGGYEDNEAQMLRFDLDGYSEPVSLVSDAYRDFVTYNLMIYSRGELFFQQLRYIVGDDVMHRILRTYYDRWKLKHVTAEAFQQVAEEVSKRDLSTFFGQWLHSVELYDYAVGDTRVTVEGEGWATRVEVVRKAPGRIPVEVAVVAEGDTALARTEGLAEREWVTLRTRTEPKSVVVDPRVRAHDWNLLDNRKNLGFHPLRSVLRRPGTDFYFHSYFSTRSRRDRYTLGVHPTVWYNDAGGITLGLRSRGDYLGRFEQNQTLVSVGTGWAADGGETDVDFFLRLRNPVWLRATNVSETLDAFRIEGRYGARGTVEWARKPHLTFGPSYRFGGTLEWVRTDNLRYLDPGYYEDAGTVELKLHGGVSHRSGEWDLAWSSVVGGGFVYGRSGVPAAGGSTASNELYFRGTTDAAARRAVGKHYALGVRAFAGLAEMRGEAPRQRRIFLAGADPYQQLSNPFLRSRGALLVGQDFHYHAPGGANLRGFDPRVNAAFAFALNGELQRAIRDQKKGNLFRRVALTVFGDAAVADAPIVPGGIGDAVDFFGDAGVGIVASHRIGQTDFVTRVDFPLLVSRPVLAQDDGPGSDELGFRWTFSFEPGF